MDTVWVQLTTLLFLFVGSFVFGILPLICVKLVARFANEEEEWIRKNKVATFLLYFGGGVFISNSFLALLPKARRELEHQDGHADEDSGKPTSDNSPDNQSGHHHDSFPIPEFMILCSFFGAYIIQEILYLIFLKVNKIPRKTSDARVRFCTCAKRHTECSRTFKDAKPDQTLFRLEKKLTESGKAADCVVGVAAGSEAVMPAKSELLRSSIIAQQVPNYGTITNATELTPDSPLPVLTPPVLIEDERRLALEQHIQTSNYNAILISSMLTIIALTLQYIFVGLNVGLQATSIDKWPFLAVTCLQNFILIFSSGSELAAGSFELFYTIMCIAVLSCISPIGIAAVMWDSKAIGTISDTAKGAVASVACGTLLYATFCQILRQKRPGSVDGLKKFCAVTMGASVMAAVHYGVLAL